MLFQQLVPFAKRIRQYFRAYGGWSTLLGSPFLWLSVAVGLLGYSQWLTPKWVDLSQLLIPSLLGFSLGTYAILFGLMTGRLKRALKLAKNKKGISYLDEVNATFFHFIFVQVLALMWGIVYSGSALSDLANAALPYASWATSAFSIIAAIGSFIGMVLVVYSLLLIVAAALAVYRLALVIDDREEG